MVLLVLASAFLVEVYLGDVVDVPNVSTGLFVVSALLFVVGLGIRRRRLLPAVALLILALGILRVGDLAGDGTADLLAFRGQREVLIEGTVKGDPAGSGSILTFPFEVDKVGVGGFWTDEIGTVLVTVRPSIGLAQTRPAPHIRGGDRLLLGGDIERPPEFEGFDYPAYLAQQGIGAVMPFPEVTLLERADGVGASVSSFRRAVARSLEKVVPEPQAAMGQTLLLGLRDGLPEDMVDDFRVTGTSHLLAISGLHMTIVLIVLLGASRWAMGRRRGLYLIAPLLVIWGYTLLAGMPPSATRAAIMGTVYLAALWVGRPRSVLPALGLAAATMVAVEPRVLWDVSFQLSFAAMAGIATLTEPLVVRLRPLGGVPADGDLQTQPLRSFVVFASATTIAATLSTWPLVAFYFERVSLVGLPATLLTLPIMPVVLVAHGAAGLVGIVSDELARPIGWVAWVSTAYMTTVVGLIARLPGTSVQTGGLAPALVVGYYAGLAVVHWRGRVLQAVSVPLDLIRRWQPPWDRAISWWIAGPAAALAVLVWSAAFSLPDGDLHVTFVDVGQGDMAVVTTPNGRTIVVDGGPDPLAAARVIGDELPFWRRHIDLVVLTHPHQDHVAGVAELLDRYEVSHVVQRAVDYDSTAYETWNTAVDGEGAIVTDAAAGQSIVTDDGVLIQVLGPPAKLLSGSDSDVDNASVVLRIVYGELSFLLAADVFADGERALVDGRSVLDSDVLKVAHHGSRSSSISEFIEAVSPAAAVVSAGEGNRFGHPHAETLEVLHRHVTVDRLFVTSARGSVEFVTDGKHLRVYSER